MKKVLIAGATGAMGQKAVDLVNSLAGFEITAALAPTLTKENMADFHLTSSVHPYQTLDEIEDGVADIWIDFTILDLSFRNWLSKAMVCQTNASVLRIRSMVCITTTVHNFLW